MHELLSEGHLGPVLSAALVDIFGTLGVAAIVGFAWVERMRKLRQADAAEASADVNQQLQPGAAVLHGEVEYARSAQAAVRVDVDQDGSEWESSGVWSHKWTEKRRHVHVEPFYLRLQSGSRIRIEPSGDVLLVDAMEGVIRVNLTSRTRYTELVPGETIYASGQLVRAPDPEANTDAGYRQLPESWVLRPLPPQPMLLSTETLGARFVERAAFHARYAVAIGALALGLHTLFWGYHARRYVGQTEHATVTSRDRYTTKDSEGSDIVHYKVTMHRTHGEVLTDHVTESTFYGLHEGELVPVRIVPEPFHKRSSIGPDLTVHWTGWVFVPYVFVAWFVYRYRDRTTRPWYERSIVDVGPGRLEESFTQHQPDAKASS